MPTFAAGESKLPKVYDRLDTFVGCQANGCQKHVMPDSSTHCVEHNGRIECKMAGCRKIAKSFVGNTSFCWTHGLRCTGPVSLGRR
jgi:hypothetical protein